jgi:hypothetical protein
MSDVGRLDPIDWIWWCAPLRAQEWKSVWERVFLLVNRLDWFKSPDEISPTSPWKSFAMESSVLTRRKLAASGKAVNAGATCAVFLREALDRVELPSPHRSR